MDTRMKNDDDDVVDTDADAIRKWVGFIENIHNVKCIFSISSNLIA